jgi:phosphocarrier protein HPr
MARAERDVQIKNRLGMHARAAVRFVQLANGFRSEVKVIKDGQEANGKSIMGLLTLVGAHGVTMTIVCEGEDAPAAVAALGELVDTGFGEGVDPFIGGGG